MPWNRIQTTLGFVVHAIFGIHVSLRRFVVVLTALMLRIPAMKFNTGDGFGRLFFRGMQTSCPSLRAPTMQ
ncbi:hypothetical protein C8R44DRAFT_342285 [Mycena epipterygia]|nr:hypothetical protein C8R44DRAFT_342285 [Mycena epipterygia]